MKKAPIVLIRIPASLHQRMLDDLRRPHAFAAERVGFLHTKSKWIGENVVLVIATDYVPVQDDHYIDDDQVGAKINSSAIRAAMQQSFEKQGGCFHVHLHDHRGRAYPSPTDKRGLPGVVESLANIAPQQANGLIILSKDSFYSVVKLASVPNFIIPKLISIVGRPLRLTFAEEKSAKSRVYDRQSFLGESSEFLFSHIRVGVIGYGGGGSHIGLQLAHLGVKNIIVFDDDQVEDTNLNRLVGAWANDVKGKVPKTKVAERVIKKVLPTANVILINSRWQLQPELLQTCDVVFGCVDSFAERQQVEAQCRRYLIPYIDIGMDVHQTGDDPYAISGQIILSVPGCSCLSCFNFLTQQKLGQEAAKYGKVGGRPQVVWPNGVLASTAVGLFVNLVTNWTCDQNAPAYLSYDGNTGLIGEHIRARFTPETCPHFPLTDVGTPVFTKI